MMMLSLLRLRAASLLLACLSSSRARYLDNHNTLLGREGAERDHPRLRGRTTFDIFFSFPAPKKSKISLFIFPPTSKSSSSSFELFFFVVTRNLPTIPTLPPARKALAPRGQRPGPPPRRRRRPGAFPASSRERNLGPGGRAPELPQRGAKHRRRKHLDPRHRRRGLCLEPRRLPGPKPTGDHECLAEAPHQRGEESCIIC